jgi:hypothetical protein
MLGGVLRQWRYKQRLMPVLELLEREALLPRETDIVTIHLLRRWVGSLNGVARQTGTKRGLTMAITQKAKIGTQVLMVFSSAVDSNALHNPVDHTAWTRVVRIETCTHAQMVSKQL